jgi:hypothetical protein
MVYSLYLHHTYLIINQNFTKMKKLLLALVLVPVLLAFTPKQTLAQIWTGYLYGRFQIEDSSPGSYDVFVKLLYDGTSTGWVTWGTTTTVGSPLQINGNIVTGFSVPIPVSANYYGIAVIAFKNSNQNDWRYNSSVATPTLISPYHMSFDANTDPIVVKWP